MAGTGLGLAGTCTGVGDLVGLRGLVDVAIPQAGATLGRIGMFVPLSLWAFRSSTTGELIVEPQSLSRGWALGSDALAGSSGWAM